MTSNNADRAHRQSVRTRVRAWRRGLSAIQVEAMSRVIARQVLELEPVRAAPTVCIYMGIPGEVQTGALSRDLLAAGKRLAVPRVVRGEASMTVREVRDLARDLAPGVWDILTPHASCPELSPFEIDVVLVPGLAFDASLHRIGNGAGYYDRFLAAATDATRIGLFFSQQQVESCRPQPWDVPLDLVVTERGVLARPAQ